MVIDCNIVSLFDTLCYPVGKQLIGAWNDNESLHVGMGFFSPIFVAKDNTNVLHLYVNVCVCVCVCVCVRVRAHVCDW